MQQKHSCASEIGPRVGGSGTDTQEGVDMCKGVGQDNDRQSGIYFLKHLFRVE